MGEDSRNVTSIDGGSGENVCSRRASGRRLLKRAGHLALFGFTVVFCAEALLFPSQPAAVSLHDFRDMRNYASGGLVYWPGLDRLGAGEKGGLDLAVRAGELRLFEIPGLKVNSLTLDLAAEVAAISLSLSFLKSPVGGEKKFSLRVTRDNRSSTSFAADVNLYIQNLNATDREFLLSCSVKMFLAVSGNVGAGYTIGDLAIAGEKMPGADVSVFLGFFTSGGSVVLPFIGFDRWGERGMGLASAVHLAGERLELMGSFNSNTEEIRGALEINAGSVQLTFGAAVHPVLGTSKGVTLGWGF